MEEEDDDIGEESTRTISISEYGKWSSTIDITSSTARWALSGKKTWTS